MSCDYWKPENIFHLSHAAVFSSWVKAVSVCTKTVTFEKSEGNERECQETILGQEKQCLMNMED